DGALPRLGYPVRARDGHDRGRRRDRRGLRRRDRAPGIELTWLQREVRLEPRPRGFHLVTDEIARAVPELERFEVGMAHVFIRHTSASLTLNENASPAVRRDFRAWVDEAVPDDAGYRTHTPEGPDDRPAHIKAA